MVNQKAYIHEIMARAVALARNADSLVYPNPKVGAVIFDDEGTILAEGWHRCCGGDHAEIDALKRLSCKARGLSMAVTLEPCNHFGKTPPCTHAIAAAGIKKVYIASYEPTDKARGGCDYLASHGIPTEFVPGFEEELAELNRFFYTTVAHKRPWVTLKVAMTMDGFVAPLGGSRFPISGKESLCESHHLRAEHMGVAVGAGTVNRDDPLLTVRYVAGPHPQPVIFSASLSLHHNRKIIERRPIIFTEVCDETRLAPFREYGCRIEIVRREEGISSALGILWGKYRINSLLVEGGASLYASFFTAGISDEVIHFIAPFALGAGVSIRSPSHTGTLEIPRFSLHHIERLGDDVKITWRQQKDRSECRGHSAGECSSR